MVGCRIVQLLTWDVRWIKVEECKWLVFGIYQIHYTLDTKPILVANKICLHFV